jgi:hypothetical protein
LFLSVGLFFFFEESGGDRGDALHVAVLGIVEHQRQPALGRPLESTVLIEKTERTHRNLEIPIRATGNPFAHSVGLLVVTRLVDEKVQVRGNPFLVDEFDHPISVQS